MGFKDLFRKKSNKEIEEEIAKDRATLRKAEKRKELLETRRETKAKIRTARYGGMVSGLGIDTSKVKAGFKKFAEKERELAEKQKKKGGMFGRSGLI